VKAALQTKPEVSFLRPTANEPYTAPATIAIEALAKPAANPVAKVEFFEGTKLLATSTKAPYRLSLADQPKGKRVLTAIATDSKGVKSSPVTVNFAVYGQPPAVSIDAPANRQVFEPGTPVTVTLTATDGGLPAGKVELYSNDKLLVTLTQPPFIYTFAAPKAGNYLLQAKAFDVMGSVTNTPVTKFRVKGALTSTPYGGAPIAVPGTFKMVDYDKGGPDSAYWDSDPTNNGEQIANAPRYRPEEAVDTQVSSAGGFNVGWIESNEWINYSLAVAKAGNYDFTWTVATPKADNQSSFVLQIDGNEVTDVIGVPSTGDWQAWKPLTVRSVPLKAGRQILTFSVLDSAGFNVDKVTVIPSKE
jgi:hypothetical protein